MGDRVLSVICGELGIDARDVNIENFVPEKYYGMVSNEETNGEKVELVSKQKFAFNMQNKALAECEKYNASEGSLEELFLELTK